MRVSVFSGWSRWCEGPLSSKPCCTESFSGVFIVGAAGVVSSTPCGTEVTRFLRFGSANIPLLDTDIHACNSSSSSLVFVWRPTADLKEGVQHCVTRGDSISLRIAAAYYPSTTSGRLNHYIERARNLTRSTPKVYFVGCVMCTLWGTRVSNLAHLGQIIQIYH